jgi:hypothetical protein
MRNSKGNTYYYADVGLLYALRENDRPPVDLLSETASVD